MTPIETRRILLNGVVTEAEVRGAMLIACGVGLGLLAALGAVRGVAALLYGVSPFEPVLLGFAVVPIVLAALLACWLPARRATKVDPMSALRAE